jgi:hypothetical protein
VVLLFTDMVEAVTGDKIDIHLVDDPKNINLRLALRSARYDIDEWKATKPTFLAEPELVLKPMVVGRDGKPTMVLQPLMLIGYKADKTPIYKALDLDEAVDLMRKRK